MESVRWCSAEVLGEIGDKRAVEPLIQALKDVKADVRKSAAEALGKLRDRRATEPLIQALKDVKRDVRGSATEALAKIGEPAVEPLISALRDKDTNVQKGSAETLGEIGDKRAVEPLIHASKVEDEAVRKAAENALEQIQRRKEELHEGESDLAKQMADLRNTAFKRLDSRKTVVEHPDKKERREVEEVKLKPEQIKEIRDWHARGYRDFDIAKRMGISKKSVTKQLEEERERRLEEAYTQSRKIRT